MRRFHLFIMAASLALCGCTTQRLQDNTLSSGASITDIYYQMVLQNLARAYVQPGVLPWGMSLASGNVAVNDSAQLMGGYSETYPAVMPSANAQYQIVLQQSWATAPVSNETAFRSMMKYYAGVVAYANHESGKRYLVVTKLSPHEIPPTVGSPGYVMTDKALQSPPIMGVPDLRPKQENYYRADFSFNSDPNAYLSIDLKAFQFTTKSAPPDSLYATYQHGTAYVTRDVYNIHNLALFSMLILGTIDNIPPKTPAGAPPTPPLAH